MIEQSLYCVLGKQKKWLLCHKQGRTCIRALCVTLSFTRVTPMWSHTCFLLVIHLNNHLIFKVKEARKETDFLGYRGMKTSSSTQLLSRPITASMNVCVGHKYTLSTQTYCLFYIYMYFMQTCVKHFSMTVFIMKRVCNSTLSAPHQHRCAFLHSLFLTVVFHIMSNLLLATKNHCRAWGLLLECNYQKVKNWQSMMNAWCWLYLDWFTLLPFKDGIVLL